VGGLASWWACFDTHNSEEYFPTRLRPGVEISLMFPNSLESGVHTSTKEELYGPPPDVLVKLSMCDTWLGGGAWSLKQSSFPSPQELTNFFSLNLELWKFTSRSLNILQWTKHNNVSPITLLEYCLLIGLMLLARVFRV